MSSKLNALFEQNNNNNTQGKPEFKKSTLWINVGYYEYLTNEETGEEEQVFVSLPVGIPLDSMKPAMSVSNKRLAQIRDAQNKLLDAIQQYGLQNLEPGESKALPNFSIEIRKVAGEAHIEEGENPLTANLAKLF